MTDRIITHHVTEHVSIQGTEAEVAAALAGVDIGNPISGDLISREAAIAYHIERKDAAKREANACRAAGDDDSAADWLKEAIIHSDAANAIRALPAALEWANK